MSQPPPPRPLADSLPDEAPDDGGYFEIVILVKQIDAQKSPNGAASEQTVLSINVCNRETLKPSIPTEAPRPVHNDRTRKLQESITGKLEHSLPKLAKQWTEATEALFAEPAARSVAKMMVITEGLRRDAALKLNDAFRGALGLHKKYALTDAEIAKEIQKKLLWAVILYVVFKES